MVCQIQPTCVSLGSFSEQKGFIATIKCSCDFKNFSKFSAFSLKLGLLDGYKLSFSYSAVGQNNFQNNIHFQVFELSFLNHLRCRKNTNIWLFSRKITDMSRFVISNLRRIGKKTEFLLRQDCSSFIPFFSCLCNWPYL